METPAGYDYTPPKGYKAFENPTFPEKLYEAAEEILIVTPTTPKLTKGYIAPPQGYDYSPPKGYKAEENPTFPQSSYNPPVIDKDYGPRKKVKKHKMKKTVSGYNYEAPDGYKANLNPTFPKNIYETPQIEDIYEPPHIENLYEISHAEKTLGYKPPAGYDYKSPPGYSASKNPTFPSSSYKAPFLEKDYGKDSSYSPPPKDSYGPPPKESYIQPKELYSAPSKESYSPPLKDSYGSTVTHTPPSGYIPPTGYDYHPPSGYDPDINPTFPKDHYAPAKLKQGDAPPSGYDYSPPKGYLPEDNPTFPDTSYKKPKTSLEKEYIRPHKSLTHPKKSEISSLKDSLTYLPPSKKTTLPKEAEHVLELLYEEPQLNQLHQRSNKRPALNLGYEPPLLNDYKEPNYMPPDNNDNNVNYKQPPTLKQRDYIPPLKDGYGQPQESYVPPSNDYDPPKESYDTDDTPKESYGQPENYPSHQFNIIIKNKNKPDTSISITPNPPILTVTHGKHKNKGGIVPEPPEKLYTTPGSESGRPNNDGRPPALSGDDTLFRKDVKDHSNSNFSPDKFDYIVDTNKHIVHQVIEDKPKLTKERINLTLSQLRRGTEQLLFSFLLPSTLSTTSNIVDLQKLVTSGCMKLQRKLLFADSLAKLPYKIGGIKGVLSNMMNLFHELQIKNEGYNLSTTDYLAVRAIYKELQEHTLGLCKGGNSLPVLAVELQNSCHLLQDAKVVTIFNMIAVPCFVYQGAVGLIGDLIHELPY